MNIAMGHRHMLSVPRKDRLCVYKSPISGNGVYALKDYEEGEVVMDYAGEVIRGSVSDLREKRYEKQVRRQRERVREGMRGGRE